MLWFQWWTSAVSWPLNVGGKPWNSLPAFVPIIFEGMVLAAGLGTVFALLVVARLRPGKQDDANRPGRDEQPLCLAGQGNRRDL